MNKSIKYFFILFFLFIVFFGLSTTRYHFFSDEASYFSITQSIAHDLDIEYKKEDIQRIREQFPTGPLGVFLKKTRDNRLFYSKSFIYSVFAAPFYKIFGTGGIVLFNGLMIFLILFMSFYFLKQYFPEKKSFFFSLVFLFATVTPVYIWWMQPGIFNMFTVFAGLFFFFYKFRNSRWSYLSPVIFSVSVFSKPSNLLPIVVIFLILLIKRDWKKFVLFSLIAVLLTGCLFLITYWQTGEINFMGGNRRTFYGPYPFEKDAATFDRAHKMSADNYWERQTISPRIVLLNLFYYLFGRFTGMFIYFFPAFMLLICFCFQEKSREDWMILISIIVGILFYIFITPNNYFGGGGSVGNRYFLSLYPLFFFLGYKKRNIKKHFLIPVAVSLIFLSSTFVNSLNYSKFARMTGINFPANLFPPEKTQYRTLPSNELPDAFGKTVKDAKGKNSYKLFFLNNNFWKVEKGSYFWTRGDGTVEFFLRSMQGEVKEFMIELTNIPKENRVSFKIEDKRREFSLQPDQPVSFSMKNVQGLKIDNSYLYYITIKSEKFFIPSLDKKGDRRKLGVKVQIGLVN